MLYENYEQVVANVKKACERSGRNFQDITIVAVSKTKPLSDVEELLSHGVMEFGENKVQEMVDKYEHVSKPDRKSTRLNSSHSHASRMPSSA